LKSEILFESVEKLFEYLEKNDFTGYDPIRWFELFSLSFDFEEQILIYSFTTECKKVSFQHKTFNRDKKRKINKRNRLYLFSIFKILQLTGNKRYLEKSKELIKWVIDNRSPYFENYSWGNHFDYVSRVFYLKKGMPTLVWTGLIGNILVEFYLETKDEYYKDAIYKTAKFIIDDLPTYDYDHTFCISYIPYQKRMSITQMLLVAHSYLRQKRLQE